MADGDALGIGQDGYFRIQKESVYGTAVTNSMTDLPLKAGSGLVRITNFIENQNILGNRLKQAPNAGSQVSQGDLIMDYHPSLVGLMYNLLFGTSANATLATGDYSHVWLIPTSGVRVGGSATTQQARGAGTAEQNDGVVITGFSMTGNTDGNIEITWKAAGQGFTDDVARVSSFSYPALIPFNWSFGTFTITPSGGSDLALPISEFTIEYDSGLEYPQIRFGSAETQQPSFQTIPTLTGSITVDAEDGLMDYQRLLTAFDVVLTLTSTETISTSEKYKLVLEMPGCRLTPDNSMPNDNDRIQMNMSFECGYGGTTTNSSGANVMGEVYIQDGTAAYA